MKRILFILPCLFLCCLLVAAPLAASAADVSYSCDISIGAGTFTEPVVPGMYNISFVMDSGETYTASNCNITSDGGFFSSVQNPDVGFTFQFYEYDGVNAYDVAVSGEFDVSYSGLLTLTPSSSSNVPVKGDSSAPVVSVFDVFAGVGSWIIGSLGGLSAIFWVESSGTLTVLGTLAVSALGIGVVLGLIAIIRKFLKFRS